MMNLPYWSPSRMQRWSSWWALCDSFPHSVIPRNKDLPEIDCFQIFPIAMPEVPDGYSLEWMYEPRYDEDGRYYETYILTKDEEE